MIIAFIIALIAIVLIIEYLSIAVFSQAVEGSMAFSAELVEENEPFELIFTITNPSSRFIPFVCYRVFVPHNLEPQINDRFQLHTMLGETYFNGTTWLAPHQTVEKHVPMKITKRGYYAIPRLELLVGDFLGLKEKFFSYDSDACIVAYPSAIEGFNTDAVLGGFYGEVSVNRFIHEDPVLTIGYRDYTGREPMKSISWAATARTGELMVKSYDHTTEPSVNVLVSIDEGSGVDAYLEEVYALARTILEQLDAKGIKYDFRINAKLTDSYTGGFIAEGLGARHLRTIYDVIGRATSDPAFDCRSMIDKSIQNAGIGRGIILITPDATSLSTTHGIALAKSRGCTFLVIGAKQQLNQNQEESA